MKIRYWNQYYLHINPGFSYAFFSIERMPESKLMAASHALSRAFMKDPLQTYTFPDEEERRQKSPDQFAAILRYGLLCGPIFQV
jgi:hypothetical protein